MPLKKMQISLDCEHCRFAGGVAENPHTFYVRVNVEDQRTHRDTSALLECKVDQQSHHVRLVELGEEEGIDRERLEQALEIVAEKRLCGNSRICPAEIVDIVKDIQDPLDPD